MLTDISRAETSLTSAKALAAWNAMTRGFLAHGADTPVHLASVLTEAPDFAMAHAARGLFSLMLGRREMVDVARSSLAAARASGSGTPREAAWVEALDAWLGGRPHEAVAHIEGVLTVTPEDTLSMKVSQAIRFMRGDSHGMRRSAERVLQAHGDDHPLRGFVLGCLAFALEETGDYGQAERTGLAGLEIAPDDAWGLHAVAHVHDMTHRPMDGIALIDRNSAAWNTCNNFRFHVWWHKALLHLDLGQTDTVLALYDRQIRQDRTDDYRDFSNASSLLTRLELDGVDVGDRWEELADLAERRLDDGCLVFADLHYMLALAGDGRRDAAARLVARMTGDAGSMSEGARIAAHPGIAASEGLAAFGEGRYHIAFAKLVAARNALQSVGGSHAQRDVFERVAVDAGIRAGRLDCARALLLEREALRAGARDAFAASRFDAIAAAQKVADRMAAQ